MIKHLNITASYVKMTLDGMAHIKRHLRDDGREYLNSIIRGPDKSIDIDELSKQIDVDLADLEDISNGNISLSPDIYIKIANFLDAQNTSMIIL